MKTFFLAGVLAFVLFATGDTGYDDLPINKVQVIGSHNSYKQAIDTALFSLLREKNPKAAMGLEYSHVPLDAQLDLGLRNLEIDVYADEKGGKYAHPKGLDWEAAAHPPAYDPEGEMNKPGFMVPEKFTTVVFDRLDKELLDNLGRGYLLTPDDIRGHYPTLEKAVLDHRWPTMKAVRGKFVFILDESGEHRAAYIQGHPSLQGRVLFTDSPEGEPEAAFMIINDAKKDKDRIRQMVSKGYMVRTRADADTREARVNDNSSFLAACASGAQIITTDYYYKSSFFKSEYKVSFEGGTYVRRMP